MNAFNGFPKTRGIAILGVDPGLSGGLALLHPDDGMRLEPMPLNREGGINLPELVRLLRDWSDEIKVAWLEDVHAMPGQGVTSMFTFGRVFGMTEAALIAADIPVMKVRAARWTKVMHEGSRSEPTPKKRSLNAFERIFPGVDARASERCRKPHDGLVDAALIAEYGRRYYE